MHSCGACRPYCGRVSCAQFKPPILSLRGQKGREISGQPLPFSTFSEIATAASPPRNDRATPRIPLTQGEALMLTQTTDMAILRQRQSVRLRFLGKKQEKRVPLAHLFLMGINYFFSAPLRRTRARLMRALAYAAVCSSLLGSPSIFSARAMAACARSTSIWSAH